MSTLFRRSNGTFYLLTSLNGRRIWKSTGCKTRTKSLKWLAEQEKQVKAPELVLSRFRTQFLSYASANLARTTVDLFIDRGLIDLL